MGLARDLLWIYKGIGKGVDSSKFFELSKTKIELR
jgi:hypothetical protein